MKTGWAASAGHPVICTALWLRQGAFRGQGEDLLPGPYTQGRRRDKDTQLKRGNTLRGTTGWRGKAGTIRGARWVGGPI